MVLWYNYYSYYCALLFCCSQVFVICFGFFCSQILLHTWTDWWLVLSNAFLTPVSFYCFLDWRLVLNIAFLTPVSFYCFLDWRLGLNFEHRLSYTSFFLLLSGLKISLEHRLLYTSFLLLLSWTASKRKSVKFATSLIAYNLRFFILSTTLSTTLHKRTHSINQHTKPIIEFSEIPKEARCSQWGPMDIQVFMKFFYYWSITRYFTNLHSHNAQNCSQKKQNVLSFCALSFTSFHMFRVPTLQWGLYFCTRKRARSRPHKSYRISKWPIPLTIGIFWKSLSIYKGEKTLGYGNIIRFKVKKLGLLRNIFHNQV